MKDALLLLKFNNIELVHNDMKNREEITKNKLVLCHNAENNLVLKSKYQFCCCKSIYNDEMLDLAFLCR